MAGEDGSDDNSTTNKGVNVCSETSPGRVGAKCCCDVETSTSLSSLIHARSIKDIRNEIQTVLELMGPTTPICSTLHNTSSEADNEESSISLNPKQKASKSSRRRSISEDTMKLFSAPTTVRTPTEISTNDFDSSGHVCIDPENTGPCHCLNPDCVRMAQLYNNLEQKPPVPALVLETNRGFTNQNSVTTLPDDLLALETNDVSANRNAPRPAISDTTTKKGLLDWLKTRSVELIMKKSTNHCPCELYKINISEDGGRPKRVVFDLVEGIPKPTSSNVATNTIKSPVEKYTSNFKHKCDDRKSVMRCNCKESKNVKNGAIQETEHKSRDCDGNIRVDFYYFDHGNAQYFNTTDTPPVMVCELIAEKTEKYTTKFWAEIFATIHIAFSFCISFVLQLFKFLLYGIIRPLTVGLMQMLSDYFFKPFLTALFNGILQPCLIFLYNVATSVRDLCDPIAECFGYFLRELAVLFRAIRLCTYKKNVDESSGDSSCEKKRKYVC